MRRAVSLIRPQLHYRREMFDAGLRASGFRVVQEMAHPGPGDALLIWNRYGSFHQEALRFEAAGAVVLVAENGYLGKSWNGDTWFALALGHHAGAGIFPFGGPERWDGLGIEPEPWRAGGGEVVVLGQRGIGEPGIRSPDRWERRAASITGGRVRAHPGRSDEAVDLRDDLSRASSVATWHSGAALRALLWGISVWYDFPLWIGALAGRRLSEFGGEPLRDDAARLSMFRRLAWAQWRAGEIASGAAMAAILDQQRARAA